MRNPRLVVWVLAAVLVASACDASDDGSAASTSPSTAATSAPSDTTSATTTTTSPNPSTTTTAPGATPTYLVYGWEGVTRVHGDTSEQLATEPVRWATRDGAGGVVFSSVAEQPGWVWMSAGADRPLRISLGDDGWPRLRSVFLLEDRPSALVSRSFEGMSLCEPRDYFQELTILDLETGEERLLMCHNEGPDAGEFFTSYGGSLFSSVAWLAVGASGTNSFLWFYNLNGERVPVEHNPFAESCAPCQLSAELSPDGSLLAYALWPTAYWQQPEPPDGDYTRAHREWYARQQHIATEVVVMEMTTGAEVFRTEVAADGRLTDFDGRFATVTGEDGYITDPGIDSRRLLIDIAIGETFEAPPAMNEGAGFWTAILASLDTDTSGYDDAQRLAGELAFKHGLATGVMWSCGFLTMNPGHWAVFTGHFDTQEQAAAQCDAIDTACYPRYVATAYTIDPELGRSMLTLEPDGLGLVEFGDPEHEVVALFERILGSRPTDVGGAEWVEYVGWTDFGLYLGFSRPGSEDGFSRPGYEDYDIPRLVGWQSYGGSVELDLNTPSGVGVGATIADLREIYDDDLVIPTEPYDCIGFGVWLLGPDRGIWAELHEETGVVQGLSAGAQVGC